MMITDKQAIENQAGHAVPLEMVPWDTKKPETEFEKRLREHRESELFITPEDQKQAEVAWRLLCGKKHGGK